MGDGGSKVARNFSTDDGEGVFDSKGEQWRLVIKAYISAVGIINVSEHKLLVLLQGNSPTAICIMVLLCWG